MKKFIFSKFGGLQACSRQLYYQMNSFTGIFRQHVKLPPCPPQQIFRTPPPPPPIGGGTASSCSQHLWETLLNGYDIQKLGSFAWGNRSSRIYLKKFCSGAQDRDIYYWILLFFIVWILNIQEWTIFFSVLHKLAGTIFAFSRLEKESVL